jgi:CrcB protein
VVEADLDRRWEVVVGVGLCGTLTTYSSFALEVRALGGRTGAVYGLTTVVACLLAAAVGMALA